MVTAAAAAVDVVGAGRMTPMLFSMVMVVPSGADSFCKRARMRCAISGGASRGNPRCAIRTFVHQH